MGKDKKKKKGTALGYLLILVGLVLLGAGVILAFAPAAVPQVENVARSVPVLKDHIGDANVRYGIAGAGLVLLVLGALIRPKSAKKK